MKKQPLPLLPLITLLFLLAVGALFSFRNFFHPAISVTRTPASTQPLTQVQIPQEDLAPEYPININTADLSQLTLLPGIGEVTAQRILDYRRANGRFSKIEELLNIEGIGPSRFTKIMDYITTGG